jgi:OOP family OmpA-OmpF porin
MMLRVVLVALALFVGACAQQPPGPVPSDRQAGSERVNATLAMRRAERVKELLVQRGVRAERIVAVGRGSREPAVRAAEGVAEARNRRLGISVR